MISTAERAPIVRAMCSEPSLTMNLTLCAYVDSDLSRAIA